MKLKRYIQFIKESIKEQMPEIGFTTKSLKRDKMKNHLLRHRLRNKKNLKKDLRKKLKKFISLRHLLIFILIT